MAFLLTGTTEITSKSIVHTFTDFQRACITHIVEKLPSIKNLVKNIGDGVLQDFCRRGQLNQQAVKRIQGCTGPEVIYIESDIGEDDMDDGEDTDGEEDSLFLQAEED